MDWNFLFFMNSALLGVGLAMDAFSVSLANGMNEKKMKPNFYDLGRLFKIVIHIVINNIKTMKL